MTTKNKSCESCSHENNVAKKFLQIGLSASLGFLLAFALCNSGGTKELIIEERVTPINPRLSTTPSEFPQPDSWGRLPPSSVSLGAPGGSLWKFKSRSWDGYIDIRTDGRYYTHWGYGHWNYEKDGSVLLVNDYDGFTHRLAPAGKGIWKGERNDGDWERIEWLYDYAHEPKARD